MFNMFTDVIENALNMAGGLAEGELPTSRQVASLASAGLTVFVIAQMFGVAEDVIEGLMDE